MSKLWIPFRDTWPIVLYTHALPDSITNAFFKNSFAEEKAEARSHDDTCSNINQSLNQSSQTLNDSKNRPVIKNVDFSNCPKNCLFFY